MDYTHPVVAPPCFREKQPVEFGVAVAGPVRSQQNQFRLAFARPAAHKGAAPDVRLQEALLLQLLHGGQHGKLARLKFGHQFAHRRERVPVGHHRNPVRQPVVNQIRFAHVPEFFHRIFRAFRNVLSC
ncbi:hypothetical protein [Victivallis vadensis]|uniref:hypothetical protein n=1 Tax=Victivallis vadensis TaxID=172901 RepID=UPI003AF4A2A8